MNKTIFFVILWLYFQLFLQKKRTYVIFVFVKQINIMKGKDYIL